MTIKDVIDGFREGEKENTERDAYANVLFQEAVRIGMELNNQYHTPEELREIMGRLTGKKIDDTLAYNMNRGAHRLAGISRKDLKSAHVLKDDGYVN